MNDEFQFTPNSHIIFYLRNFLSKTLFISRTHSRFKSLFNFANLSSDKPPPLFSDKSLLMVVFITNSLISIGICLKIILFYRKALISKFNRFYYNCIFLSIKFGDTPFYRKGIFDVPKHHLFSFFVLEGNFYFFCFEVIQVRF